MRIFLTLAICLSLSACGGGGSETPKVVKPEPTNLVVIGNSISYVPPSGGIVQPGVFAGGWGMAASSIDKDYAHIVSSTLRLPLLVENHAELEINPFAPLPMLPITSTTIVVVELGDNGLPAKYAELLASVKHAHTLVCVSTWWPNAARDAVIERECTKAGGQYAWIGDLWPVRKDLVGTYENVTVDNHPQDWGMAHIAERVLIALER